MESESDLRGVIRDWLVRNGITPREEYQMGVGRADLYLGGYRVIIEVKTRQSLRNGPHTPRPSLRGENETPFEQVSRYVEADRSREQTRLDEDRDSGWVGCVTDSERWWVWTYPADGGEPQRFLNFDGIIPAVGEMEALLGRFRRGTQWAPPSPFFLFKPALRDLEGLYRQRKGARETRIQRQLWLEQLRASGNPPDPSAADGLFVRHTLLILISRLVGGADDAATGFVQWVPEGGALANLREVVRRYDWRNETGDILRSLYMDVIDPQSRLVFGEFYTPDWLAEKLCADTINDDFIREQLDTFNGGKEVHGVLDPACGSGTFLYHAARRILNSEPLQTSYLNEDRRREFVLSMVNGLDIHPVAVEMARANMRRVFPGAPSDQINIHQGDSLLVTRPDTGLHALAANSLAIFTPGNRQFMIPNGFLHDAEGIRTFVMSARDDAEMPAGLGHSLSEDEQITLQENHAVLREVIRQEGNGVWAWYIQNQASAILLRGSKVGRIVSNPPWVRFNKIYDRTRKDEMRRLAQDLGLWVGGQVSTSFDISQLFVVRCSRLYLQEGGWSSWVLPHGALYGDPWRALRDQTRERLTGRWHLGRLPFPNTPTCVLWFGPEREDGRLVKTQRGRLNPSSGWELIDEATELRDLPEFPPERSEWFDGHRPLAREGATLVPHCFVKIDTMTPDGHVVTMQSQKQPWRDLGTFSGKVPLEWIHECLFFANLMPFHIPDTTPCVLPIVRREWDPNRLDNEMYRLVYDNYIAHRGSGENTPRTLEAQYDYHGKLFSQFGRFCQTKHQVLYNAAGDNLYAARISKFHIIDAKLFSVPCVSVNEALFLTAILNAPTLLEAFCMARQSDRDFLTHIWRKVPIPRYDRADPLHEKLVRLARRAEQTATRTYDLNISEKRNRNCIKDALADQGILDSIANIVRILFPNHTI